MKTYDQIVIDTLKGIEPATYKQLSELLGYKTPQACFHLMKNLVKSGKIIKDTTKKPYQYRTNDCWSGNGIYFW